MGKVSVIIPVYNLRAYIERCLDSVLDGTYRDIEVLCVDDGSTDGTGDILDSYAARDGRVRVLHQEHRGMCAARNFAMDHMTGDYVTFVDGDDWAMPDYVGRMVANLERYGAGISAVNYVRAFDDGRRVRGSDQEGCFVFDGDGIMEAWMAERCFFCTVWGKLFRAGDVSDIRFPDYVMCEDMSFFFDAVMRCSRMVYDSSICYCYYYRQDSLVTAPFDARNMNWLTACDRLIDYASGYGRRFHTCIYAYYTRTLSTLHMGAYFMQPGQDRRACMRMVRRRIRHDVASILVNRDVRPVKRVAVACQGIPVLDGIAARVLVMYQENKRRQWELGNDIGKLL